jgi:hypothetical protein
MALAVIMATASPIHASIEAILDPDCTSKRKRATNPPAKTIIPPANWPI